MIKINMNIAKDVHRDLIREARAEKFKKLDVDYQIALEKNNLGEQNKIAIAKQKLRDLPAHSSINNAKTVDDLAGFWPVDLLGPKQQ